MPVLDFGEWPNPSRAVPSHRIQATMLYPNPKDNDKRQALRVMLDRKTLAAERRLVKPPAMWGSRCATDGLSPRCDSLSVAIVKYILQRCRAEAKAEAHFFQMAQNCLTKGMLAGEVLLIAMQMQALGQTRSVHTACRLLEAGCGSFGTTAK